MSLYSFVNVPESLDMILQQQFEMLSFQSYEINKIVKNIIEIHLFSFLMRDV